MAKKTNVYVWQISLQVKSPERPELKHELQYRVQAPSNEKQTAITKATALAERDGQIVVGVTGAARGFLVKNPDSIQTVVQNSMLKKVNDA